MHVELKDNLDARGLRMGVVVSRYHHAITESLREAAVVQFTSAGGDADDLLIVAAPGSFELTAVCRALAHRGDLHAVVALGCILTGQTTHDQYLAQAVAQGLTSITVQTGVPIAFGVLTCQSMEQARERAGGAHGNKGAEAMAAAIAAARAVQVAANVAHAPRLRSGAKANGPASNGRVSKGRGAARTAGSR